MIDDPGIQVPKWVYFVMASLAGSITSLWFQPYQTMNRYEIAMSLFVGASFSYYASPWVIRALLPTTLNDPQLVGFIYYILASGYNVLIPMAVKKIGAVFGLRQEGKQ